MIRALAVLVLAAPIAVRAAVRVVPSRGPAAAPAVPAAAPALASAAAPLAAAAALAAAPAAAALPAEESGVRAVESAAAAVSERRAPEALDGVRPRLGASEPAPVAAAEPSARAARGLAAGPAPLARSPRELPAPARGARELSVGELFWLNLAGVAGAIAAGAMLDALLLGLLATFVAPIPLFYAYVLVRRMTGERLEWPGLRFSPGVSWAGRRISLRRN